MERAQAHRPGAPQGQRRAGEQPDLAYHSLPRAEHGNSGGGHGQHGHTGLPQRHGSGACEQNSPPVFHGSPEADRRISADSQCPVSLMEGRAGEISCRRVSQVQNSGGHPLWGDDGLACSAFQGGLRSRAGALNRCQQPHH